MKIEKTARCPHCGEPNIVNNEESHYFFQCRKCGETIPTPDALPDGEWAELQEERVQEARKHLLSGLREKYEALKKACPKVGPFDESALYRNPDGGYQMTFSGYGAVTCGEESLSFAEFHFTCGPIFRRWIEGGGAWNEKKEKGRFGYPTGDPMPGDRDGVQARQRFERGEIRVLRSGETEVKPWSSAETILETIEDKVQDALTFTFRGSEPYHPPRLHPRDWCEKRPDRGRGTMPFYSPVDVQKIRGNPGILLWEFHQAAAYGDEERVLECLENGVDINGRNPDFGSTALMLAAAGGYWRIAKLLLAHGARLDLRDHAGRTAKQWAIDRHRDDVLELLLGRLPSVHRMGPLLRLGKYMPRTAKQWGTCLLGKTRRRWEKSWLDQAYREIDGTTLHYDLWRPHSLPDRPRPLVILVHGGGWDGGNRHDPSVSTIGDGLLGAGFCIAAVDYRLAWKWAFPDPLEDLKAAVRHFRSRADEFGIAPDRIGVYGHSAGAHLALLLGLTSAQPVLDRCGGAAPSSVRSVCGISCPCDFQTLLEIAEALRTAVATDNPAERRSILSGLADRRDLASVLDGMNIHDFPLCLRDLSEQATARLWQEKFKWSNPVWLVRGLVHNTEEEETDLVPKREELLLASPLTHALRPAVDGPLPAFLLLHGYKDPLIPADGCRRFHDALCTHGQGVDVSVNIDPDAEHWHRDAYRLVPEFFARTLGFP